MEVIQVNQHNVISAIGGGLIKCDRANVLGVRMFQALGTRRPTVLQSGEPEDRLAGRILDGKECRLLGQRQSDLDYFADIFR